VIDRSKFLRGLTKPAAAHDSRSGSAEDAAPIVRLAALEAAGWLLDGKGLGLTRSWATDSADDRALLYREVAGTLAILDDGSGDGQLIRYTSEARGSVDPFAGLFLGLVGAAIGVVIGLIVIVIVGPGARNGLALASGLAVGFVAGVIPGVLGMYKAVEWADRLRAFRGRLELAALAGGLVTSAATALVLALVIARL
jgi:hypothetical protein